MSSKAILAGGSGLLGQALARRLLARGWEVVVLTRSPKAKGRAREVAWDGKTAGAWAKELEGARALVNFTGRSLNCVFTQKNRREILESRVNAVRILGDAMVRAAKPPAVWVQCSAVGYYGGTGLGICEETAPAGEDFLADVCMQWERALAEVELSAARKVVLRLGPVLAHAGGAYSPLAKLARCFLGGTAGSGRQGFSWVHVDDAVAVFEHAIEQDNVSGPYNLCAPQPVTNAEFMRALRHSLHRPWTPPAPAPLIKFAAKWIMKTDPQLILEGRLCAPARLGAADFPFKFPQLPTALANLAR